MLTSPLFALVVLATHASAHGFLYSIDGSAANIRGIEQLNTNIDVLRNPTTELCHGLPVSATRTPITIGDSMTLTLAISRVAIHVGYCWVEVDGVTISPTVDCVSKLRVGCPPVPNSVTADMCLQEWSFKTINRDQIKCTDCVFRWIWKATHISVTNPEPFENCWDVSLSGIQKKSLNTLSKVSVSGASQTPVAIQADLPDYTEVYTNTSTAAYPTPASSAYQSENSGDSNSTHLNKTAPHETAAPQPDAATPTGISFVVAPQEVLFFNLPVDPRNSSGDALLRR